jgi:hypothetical protein
MAPDMRCLKQCSSSRILPLAAVLVLSIRPAVGGTAQAKAACAVLRA